MNPRPVLSALFAFTAASLAAHEFWLQPDKFAAPPGTAVAVSIQRGEDFTGELRPFSTERVAALRHYSATGVTDEISRVPTARELPTLPFTLAKPGTHLIALDSKPSTIVLSPDKFLSYLNSDGLDSIVQLRKAAGTENTPGRERYLRCVKTLIRSGEKSDATFAVRTGQRLEIVPRTDPLAARARDRLGFSLFFDQKPLAGALVQAWHHRDAQQLHVIKARTAADGTVAFDLPYAGPWMISVVHMIPLQGVPDLDWESYWGNLTFALSR